jgi:hypothetical protein
MVFKTFAIGIRACTLVADILFYKKNPPKRAFPISIARNYFFTRSATALNASG